MNGLSTIQFPGGEDSITFKIDPTKTPKAIDLTDTRPGAKATRGIYKLEGDIFTICGRIGEVDRPTGFKVVDDKSFLIVWKRDKK